MWRFEAAGRSSIKTAQRRPNRRVTAPRTLPPGRLTRDGAAGVRECGAHCAHTRWVTSADVEVAGLPDVRIDPAFQQRIPRWWSEALEEAVAPIDFVFGYGSLIGESPRDVRRDGSPRGFIVDVDGFRRTWGVAMDNSLDIAGYKYFVDAETGQRPPCFVAFLDIARVDGGRVNGVCTPVSCATLEELDARESNYRRIDVTESVRGQVPAIAARVWVYEGSDGGRDRRAAGDRLGRTVVQRDYLAGVWRAFEALGDKEITAFCASTMVPDCPIANLARRVLPGTQ